MLVESWLTRYWLCTHHPCRNTSLTEIWSTRIKLDWHEVTAKLFIFLLETLFDSSVGIELNEFFLVRENCDKVLRILQDIVCVVDILCTGSARLGIARHIRQLISPVKRSLQTQRGLIALFSETDCLNIRSMHFL